MSTPDPPTTAAAVRLPPSPALDALLAKTHAFDLYRHMRTVDDETQSSAEHVLKHADPLVMMCTCRRQKRLARHMYCEENRAHEASWQVQGRTDVCLMAPATTVLDPLLFPACRPNGFHIVQRGLLRCWHLLQRPERIL